MMKKNILRSMTTKEKKKNAIALMMMEKNS